MELRRLPPEEWPRLIGTELATAPTCLPPDDATVLVVEHAGEILGCWAFIRYAHVEGLWIHPAHRGRARVGAYLWHGMLDVAEEHGVQALLTAAESDIVRNLITHAGGVRLPDTYVLPVGGPR